MKDCRKIREDLSALLDGQLSPVRRADVEAHLVDCPQCREQVAQLKKLVAGIAALPDVASSPGFLGDVRRQIRAGEQATQPVTWVDVLFRPAWLKVPLEAVAAVVVLGGVLVLVRPQPRAESAKAKAGRMEELRWDFPTTAPSKSELQEAPVEFGAAIPLPKAPEPVEIKEMGRSAMTLDQSGGVTIRRDVAGLKPSQVEPSRAPSETLIVEADSVTEVQGQAEEAATPLQGRLIVATAEASARNFFVELPAANARVFKRQFAEVRRQAAQGTKPLSLVDDLSGAQRTVDTTHSFADVDKFTGVKKKTEPESRNRSIPGMAAHVAAPPVEAGGATTVLEIQVVPPRPTGR